MLWSWGRRTDEELDQEILQPLQDALDEHGVDAALNEHEVEAALDERDVEYASEYEVAEKKRKAKARQPNYVSFSSLVIVSDSFCLVTNTLE